MSSSEDFDNIVKANKIIITGFPTADDKATILGAMKTAYTGSAIVRDMFDIHLLLGKTINIQYSPGKFEANRNDGKLFLDLSFLADNTYISPTGQAVQDTAVTAITHELGHALTGRDDDGVNKYPNSTDYKGANVTFVNTIYKELGLPERVSYVAYDEDGSLHTLNFQYTNGIEIDRAASTREIYWDSGNVGDSKDLLIGGPSATTLKSGADDDFLYGAAGNDKLYGEEGADSLNGEEGADFLDGGAGNADRLFGGVGNDTLEDVSGVAEARGGLDKDTINITFAKGWVNHNNTPRSDGKITGGYGDDTITVTMNDSKFFLNMKGDEPNTSSSSNLQDGKDTIELKGSYANSVVDLGGGDDTFTGGTGNDNVSGNDGDDKIEGGIGNDRLEGGGGIDQLIGGEGNDTYVLSLHSSINSINEIKENVNGGTDTVELIYSLNLTGTGTNLENITLTGEYAINATGDRFNNVLKGNNEKNELKGVDGNDTLIGNKGGDVLIGGAGNDKLTGGENIDFFVFNSPSEGIDKIIDFKTAFDQILVSASGFGGELQLGHYLTSEQFVIGSSAETVAHRFIYNSGKLFFDKDGIGDTNSPIQIATLSGKLTHDDIYVEV